jgi:hypothetical protein
MRRVTFHGPSHRLLAYGHELFQGGSALMEDDEAQALAVNPRIDVTVTEPRPWTGKESHPAITDVSPAAYGEPEADPGEGHPQAPDDKEPQ